MTYLAGSIKATTMNRVITIIVGMCFFATLTFGSNTKVDTFSTTPVTLELCESPNNSGMATFDLTAAESMVVAPQPNISFQWAEDEDITVLIDDPAAFTSASTKVFVKIVSTLDMTLMSVEEVELVVLEANVDITFNGESLDTLERCKEDGLVNLGVSTSGNPANVMWSSSRDTLSATLGPVTAINPEYSTFIFARQDFDNGCTAIDTFFIRVDSLLDLTLEAPKPEPCEMFNNYCPGTIVRLQSNSLDPECYPDATYKWNNRNEIRTRDENGEIIINPDADTTLNGFFMLANGTVPSQPEMREYIRVTTNHACIERDTVTLLVTDTMPQLAGPNVLCPGDRFTVTLDTNYLPNFTDFDWEVISNVPVALDCGKCEGQSVVSGILPPEIAGQTITVSVSGTKDDCCSASGMHNISIPARPTISVESVCPGEDAQVVYSGDAMASYSWTSTNPNITFSDPSIEDPIIQSIPRDPFDIRLSVVTLQGQCEYDVDLRVQPMTMAAQVIIPNAFTPQNSDQPENRTFQPLDAEREPLSVDVIEDFTVWNRWGEKVYDNDSNATGWDGRQGGEFAPSDVYLYIIKIAASSCTEEATFKGDVSLIR